MLMLDLLDLLLIFRLMLLSSSVRNFPVNISNILSASSTRLPLVTLWQQTLICEQNSKLGNNFLSIYIHLEYFLFPDKHFYQH